MKKIKHLTAMVAFMCALLVAPAPVIAQSATDYVVGGLAVASTLFGAFKSKKKSKKQQNTNESTVTSTTTEDLAPNASYQSTSDMDGVSSTQQQRNMTIVTNHPDFSIKVKRCAASGKTVVIDMIFENLGTTDEIIRFGSSTEDNEVYDDQGNTYGVSYKVANGGYEDWAPGYWLKQHSLIAGVPTKVTVKIEGVPLDVESIARLQMPILCGDWGIDNNKPVIIRFIPITRQ